MLALNPIGAVARPLRNPCLLALLLVQIACGGEAREQPEPEPLEIRERVTHLDERALREPMLAQHPGGVIFAAGFSRAEAEFTDPPNLYRSADAGGSWETVDVGTAEEGALGNSDVDLAVAPDGTLYFLTMGFDRSIGEGTHVSVGVSTDIGKTWTWHELTRDRLVDRPWVSVTPDGTAHVIWNDGSGVSHAVSTDRGNSWTERPRIHPRGGSSHLAVGPGGELAVRISPISASGNRFDPGVDRLAVSTDGGDTWRIRDAPGERSWEGGGPDAPGVPRWVEPVAWDAEGRLYSMWSEGVELRLGRSTDQGASWETWTLLRANVTLYYPYLTSGPGGVLGASWFSGFEGDLRGHVGLIEAPESDGALPELRTTPPLTVDAWRRDDGPRTRDPAGEYFPVIFLHEGGLGAMLPVQASEEGNGFTWLGIVR